jgi:hypothetical protein
MKTLSCGELIPKTKVKKEEKAQIISYFLII